jgi:glycosyltransferase involved in cell wall biosynthesis
MHILLLSQFDPSQLTDLLLGNDAAAAGTMHLAGGTSPQQLARGLVERGHTVSMVAAHPSVQRSMTLRGDRMAMHLLPCRPFRRAVWDNWAMERRALSRTALGIHPDVVHAHWTTYHGLAAAELDLPRVITIRDIPSECIRLEVSLRPGFVLWGLRWLRNTRWMISRFDRVIAVSPFVETYLRYNNGFRGRLTVVPNGIPEPQSLRQDATSFPKTSVLTFGCVGGPGGIKNGMAAVRAFLKVKSSLHARLVLFGGGWQSHKQKLAGQSVEFCDYLAHADFLNYLDREIDVLVHPSRIETHGITACEAILRGIPVIAGERSGAMPWTLDYGRGGILANVEDPNELAQGMLDLALHSARRTQLVRRGAEYIRSHFSMQEMLSSYEEIYEDCLRKRS